MQAPGQIFNKVYIQAQVDKINGITDCSELQRAVNDVFAPLQAQSDAITQQLAALQPLLALLDPPTSLNAIISWLTNFINSFLKPYLKPYTDYALQAADLVAAIAELTAAIHAAAGNIQSCEVGLPTMTPPTLPTVPGST